MSRTSRGGHALSEWIDLTAATGASPVVPGAAEDCAMIYDPVARQVVLFGGKNDEDQNLNELWRLDLASNLWLQIKVEGETPPASEDHSAIYDPIGHRMLLYGGEDGPTTNKLWSLDLKSHRWRNLTDSTAPKREDHTAVFDSRGKRMIVFGGRDEDKNTHNQIWALGLDPASPAFEKWQSLAVAQNLPPPRKDHVAVFDSARNRMLIFGGWDNESDEYLGDTWACYFPFGAPGRGRWKAIKTRDSHPPRRRHGAGAYDAHRNWFLLFGGYGEEGYLNDVWAFDLSHDVWLNVTPGPQARLDHQALYNPLRQRLLIYGGDARLGHKFHDVWELELRKEPPVEMLEKVAREKEQKRMPE